MRSKVIAKKNPWRCGADTFRAAWKISKLALTLLPETSNSNLEWDRATFTHIMERGRRCLIEMKRAGKISEELRRRIEYDLDLEQNRIQRVFMRAD